VKIGEMMILTKKTTIAAAISMGARWHGQRVGGTCPRKCSKVLVVLQMLSKVSVDEVGLMHYFEKMSSASGSFSSRLPAALCPWTPQRTSVLHISSRLTPGKKSCGCPWQALALQLLVNFPLPDIATHS